MVLDRETRRAGVKAATEAKTEVLLPRGMRIAAAVAAALAIGGTVVAFTAPTIAP